MRACALALAAAGASGAARAGEAELELGRRIFLEGRNERGEPIRVLLGAQNTALAGAAAACGNCHGADGRGQPEGGVLPPDITWEELTKPYGHAHGTGRRHGPFDERSFARAVTEGIDPAGQRIDGAMPRYALPASEACALTDYLKRLAQERDPGIGDALLRLGTILPERGPAAGVGTAMRACPRPRCRSRPPASRPGSTWSACAGARRSSARWPRCAQRARSRSCCRSKRATKSPGTPGPEASRDGRPLLRHQLRVTQPGCRGGWRVNA